MTKHYCILIVMSLLIAGCTPTLWKEARKYDTVEAYNRFLQEYPDSEYSELAKSRIKILKWNAARDKNTIEAYLEYINEYYEDYDNKLPVWLPLPNLNSGNIELSYSFEPVRAAQYMCNRLTWRMVPAAEAAEAYRRFLAKHPNSNLSYVVNENLQKLEKINKLLGESNDPANYEECLEKYPDIAPYVLSRLEQILLDNVRKNGVDDRFVIDVIKPQGKPDWPVPKSMTGSMTLTSRSRIYAELELPGDCWPFSSIISFGGGANYGVPFIYANFCLHRFSNSVRLPRHEGFLFINEGDTLHRLTFVLVPDVGYVYLRGKGTVNLDDGQTVKLGY